LLQLNEADNKKIEMMKQHFKQAMKISTLLFGKFSFRKCYLNDIDIVYSNIDIINKALYTSWAVLLSNPAYKNHDFSKLGNRVLQRLAYELTNDIEYNTLLTQGTNSTRSVQYSFSKAKTILEETIKNDF
jgi:hypothetical protein